MPQREAGGVGDTSFTKMLLLAKVAEHVRSWCLLMRDPRFRPGSKRGR